MSPQVQTRMPITPPSSSLPTKSPQSSSTVTERSNAPTDAITDKSKDETPNRPDVSNIQKPQTQTSSAVYHYGTVVYFVTSSCPILLLLGF